MPDYNATEDRPRFFDGLNRMGLAWAAALTAIPLCSVFGRSLQHWAVSSWGRDGLALALALLFTTAAVGFVARACRTVRQAGLTSAVLALALAGIIYGVPTVEERMHFLLFGALAYTGSLVFGPGRAAGIVVVLAFGDEALQWLLPERYGDFHDVAKNLLGGSLGFGLIYLKQWLLR